MPLYVCLCVNQGENDETRRFPQPSATWAFSSSARSDSCSKECLTQPLEKCHFRLGKSEKGREAIFFKNWDVRQNDGFSEWMLQTSQNPPHIFGLHDHRQQIAGIYGGWGCTQQLLVACHQSPSLPSKIMAEKYQQSACAKNTETDTSYSPIPASGPCFASTFTTPFGNFRISWDNNRTILFESVVSHQTKLDANQKKREVPSISKKETISIPPAYYLSFGKRLIITAIASDGAIQKKNDL